MMAKNVVVAQSGGPSAVINNTLRGIIDTCKMFPDTFGTIYGGWHGIEGVLKEELMDLSAQPEEEVALLRVTPAAGSIGTCRYKLKEHQQKDFARVIDVFKAHDIGYFFYIGGNDSQHTAFVVSEIAKQQGLDLIATGVPKTIDNDVGDSEFQLIDHTPGYGSIARYWSHIVQGANEENMGSSPADPVLVIQAMGRKIGYIPAASRLADPKREMPLQIYMAESNLSLDALTDNVNDQLRKDGRCVIVISEGFDVGKLGEVKDSFGHTAFGSSQMSVFQMVVNHLNAKGFHVTGKARGQVMGTDQRTSIVYASTVDLDEAYKVGQKAVDIAMHDGNGWMATILREPGFIYNVNYAKVPLEEVALSERAFPQAWIAENRIDVTDEFLAYVRPLIGEDWISIPMIDGRQRFARFQKVFAEQKLAKYVPEAYQP
ncbi:diphosphate--fructose-6-phosphate 1-phosphotransferase [candidate division KSB3 bacterium]|uniref:Pyrophosphate--fructose 6-phosphate 1-phosphotransferase n=1 Tax=candidate division KSB3 bacterium TaxID=2044937 RepID=A0A9D5JVI7_9BACT|nr:diphosphate--fructose-6-phosphate 1-phosphotransferase [candidate division KSB3 bacterium]MBD3325044.1 diphosphate--fructose-6-phosphate 1-phosphotransferase [candidate division KSB3 bacterium]